MFYSPPPPDIMFQPTEMFPSVQISSLNHVWILSCIHNSLHPYSFGVSCLPFLHCPKSCFYFSPHTEGPTFSLQYIFPSFPRLEANSYPRMDLNGGLVNPRFSPQKRRPNRKFPGQNSIKNQESYFKSIVPYMPLEQVLSSCNHTPIHNTDAIPFSCYWWVGRGTFDFLTFNKFMYLIDILIFFKNSWHYYHVNNYSIVLYLEINGPCVKKILDYLYYWKSTSRSAVYSFTTFFALGDFYGIN
jgi:hypothetical protein